MNNDKKYMKKPLLKCTYISP